MQRDEFNFTQGGGSGSMQRDEFNLMQGGGSGSMQRDEFNLMQGGGGRLSSMTGRDMSTNSGSSGFRSTSSCMNLVTPQQGINQGMNQLGGDFGGTSYNLNTSFLNAAQGGEAPPVDASSFMLGPGPPIVTGESERGPPGCNLFCFHLPNELTNYDLYLLFRKFGTILSVHTMINKNTGLSRGFGFVSFTTEDAGELMSILFKFLFRFLITILILFLLLCLILTHNIRSHVSIAAIYSYAPF